MIKEDYFYSIPLVNRRNYKIKDNSFSWVRIGEYYSKVWSNSAMKNIQVKYFIDVNENTFEELNELKNTSINKYLSAIRETQRNLNVLHNNVIRFVGEDGVEHGISSFDINDVLLYEEYKDSVWGDILYDYVPKKEDYHKEFMSNLSIDGNKVVLVHYSKDKIDDGIILSTADRANNYTPQSDIGYTYFWASKNRGNDISGGDFAYYCEIPTDYVYDYSTNLENFTGQEDALRKYPYIAYYWKDEDAIVAKTKRATPISYIMYNGEKYNSNWQRL